jgi:hypothetical protein
MDRRILLDFATVMVTGDGFTFYHRHYHHHSALNLKTRGGKYDRI